MNEHFRKPRPPFARLPGLVVLLALSWNLAAATPGEDQAPANDAPPTGQVVAPQCVHGCERWGKVCNVDPRGVYKCRRVCEKFGEICE
jgi:hypothetical protein